ncbi:THOC2 [Bugula neritina]|uniref:THO complex subunit 2 n=1 Tax=Bugula neritina TaxID=10212 RepID=A0A7J7J980_BUGNE|nr:THOC2 [Bugula neritina]
MTTFWMSADVCKTWEKSGKQKIIDEYVALSKGATGSTTNSAKTLDRLLYELLQSQVKGSLKSHQVITLLKDLFKTDARSHLELVSVACIVDAETKIDKESNQRSNFLQLLEDLKSIMPPSVLKEQLDSDTLEQVGLLFKADDFNKKYIKIKTKIYYKQQKFNLLREESEGYSKLITELSPDPSAILSVEDTLKNIKSLIGCFNLDPNRVLDVVLQVFQTRLDLGEELYVPLITQYMPEYDSVCQMLGFHLKNRLRAVESKSHDENIFHVIAILMKHGVVTLDGIYPHLLPSDAVIKEKYKKTLSDARLSVKKTRAVHTGDKKEDGEEQTDPSTAEAQAEKNDKLYLTEALLKQGAWKQAKEVLDRLPQYHVTSHGPVAKVMCKLIHYVVDPVYQKHHGLPAELFKCPPFVSPYDSNSMSQAQTFADLTTLAFPMLRYLGCHLLCDASLVTKILRLVKSFIIQRSSGEYRELDGDLIYRHCLSVLDEVLLPSLCLAEANCCLAEQLWGILQLLPYTLRYQLYGQWKSQSYYTQPELIAARINTLKKAKYIFSRLTKDNVKQQGRMIGKLSHANPTVFFEYMFTQVQVYDNLIGPIVDSLKYLSSLSFDVLVYCLIESLAAPDKEKMKYDDTNLSTWLKSLASFAALALKKYQVEFAGLLQYICNQLKCEKSFDLLILREMLTKMGGIEVSEEITEQHLEAMCGGEFLRQEGGNFLQTRNVKKPSQRLKDTILKHGLTAPLAALMAQQRDCIVYKETVNVEHIKLVGKIFDQCQDTFVQFSTFLSSALTIDELHKKLPTLDVMLSEYHIPSDAAFYLIRPMLVHSINLKYEELRKQSKLAKEKDRTTAVADKNQLYTEAFSSVILPVSEQIKPLFDAKMWEELSPTLYITFWTLSAYDLYVPKSSYEREINLVKQKIQQFEQETSRDLMIAKFKAEEKAQSEHVNRVMAKLDHDKDQWFKTGVRYSEASGKVHTVLYIPRVLNTTVDAFYCARMIHTMHKIKTPNFGTLIILDRIFNDITYLITCCTENEAHRYGRFLCCILELAMGWRASKEVYEKECSKHPGFVTTFRAGAAGTNYAELSFEDFRHVCHKWQFRMTKASIACFESGNYTQIRNTLIVLTKVLPHFPMIIGVGQALERRVDRVHKEEKDKRPDLYALAMGYAGQLKGRKSHWLAEHAFHYVNPAKQAAKDASKAEAAKAESAATTPKVIKAEPKAESRSTSSSESQKSSASKAISKERAEAAAFLKEASSKGKKVDTVELPPRMKSESKADIKVVAASNGTSSKDNDIKVVKMSSSKDVNKAKTSVKREKEADIIVKLLVCYLTVVRRQLPYQTLQ